MVAGGNPHRHGKIQSSTAATLRGFSMIKFCVSADRISRVRVNCDVLADCRIGPRGQKRRRGKTLVEGWLQVKTMKVKAGI